MTTAGPTTATAAATAAASRAIASVVDSHLCTSCGTCAAVCPTHAIDLHESPAGLTVPRVDPDRCALCGRCRRVCPAIHQPADLPCAPDLPCIGRIQHAVLAHATTPSLADNAQTGGLVRALIAFALATNRADAALVVADNPANPLRPHAVLLEEPNDLTSLARSKYCTVPINALLANLQTPARRVVFVGLGCHMQSLDLACQQLPWLTDRIALRIGLFCDRVLRFTAIDHLLRCARVAPSDVAAFDYRNQASLGWPGDILIRTRTNRELSLSRKKRIRARTFFTPLHCRLCLDKLNTLADLSVGDPYGLIPHTQRTAPTAALVRTPLAREWLDAAQHAGHITAIPADADTLVQHQSLTRNRDIANAFAYVLGRRKHPLPPTFTDRSLPAIPRATRLAASALLAWTLSADTPTGNRLHRNLPCSLPFLLRAARSLTQRLTAPFRRTPKSDTNTHNNP